VPASSSSLISPALGQLAGFPAGERDLLAGGCASLAEYLVQVPDPRDPRGLRHTLTSLLLAAVAAVLAGARSFAAVGEWVTDAPPQVLAALGIRRDPLTGRFDPPDEATIRRALERIDAGALDAAVGSWLAARLAAAVPVRPSRGGQRALAVDGKSLRGTRHASANGQATHLLAVCDHYAETLPSGPAPALVAQLVQATRGLGVDLHVRAPVTAVEKRGDGLVVYASTGEGKVEVAADLVVHAAGRVPEIDDLDLEAAGIARAEKGGVAVNEYLQSVSNPAVYAAGDAAASGGLPLTPVAGMQGGIVAADLLNGNTRTPNYLGIPTVVFTTPPLARVGLDEATARAQGLRFTTRHQDTSRWYSSRRVGLAHTGFKTLVEDGTGRILGAHLLGPHAEETINIFGLAIRARLSADNLKDMVFAYPTSASDIGYML
jgi:Pyridine nucleotide-disulphide oxidoreductase, dimerisation domain/DDE_Tnp_1-associated/Pyridine nucleotide-disulphide oxidoreductase